MNYPQSAYMHSNTFIIPTHLSGTLGRSVREMVLFANVSRFVRYADAPTERPDKSSVILPTSASVLLPALPRRSPLRLLQVEKQYARREWTIYPKSNDRFGLKGHTTHFDTLSIKAVDKPYIPNQKEPAPCKKELALIR